MGEGVAFFLFQIDFLYSTWSEDIMYLAFVKYKQYSMRGIEHYVLKILTNLFFHDSFLIYLLNSPLNKGPFIFYGVGGGGAGGIW